MCSINLLGCANIGLLYGILCDARASLIDLSRCATGTSFSQNPQLNACFIHSSYSSQCTGALRIVFMNENEMAFSFGNDVDEASAFCDNPFDWRLTALGEEDMMKVLESSGILDQLNSVEDCDGLVISNSVTDLVGTSRGQTACEIQDIANSQILTKRKAFAIVGTHTNEENTDKKRQALIRGPSRRGKKKPKGMPQRPLSAYNLFFQSERPKILQESASDQHRTTFEELGKVVGQRWRDLSEEKRKEFQKLADVDALRYRKDMDVYDEKQRVLKSIIKEHPSLLRVNGDTVVPDFANDTYVSESLVQPPTLRADASAYLGRVSPGHSAPPIPYEPSNTRGCDPHGMTTHDTSLFYPWSQDRQLCPPRPLRAKPAHCTMPLDCPLPQENPQDYSFTSLYSGAEVFLPDVHTGVKLKYKVEYKCYRMSRSEADAYLANSVTASWCAEVPLRKTEYHRSNSTGALTPPGTEIEMPIGIEYV